MNDLHISRRAFVKTGLLTLAGCCAPIPFKAVAARLPQDRRLRFYNTHTQERLDVCYCEEGTYVPDAMAAIDHILRDHRTGEVKPISPKLIDLLHTIGKRVGNGPNIHIISGYRSPATNKKLRQRSRSVAKKSYHLIGHAADIRIPSIHTASLRKIAKNLKAGGVGYYPQSNFVHVDVGPVRHW